MTSVRRVSFVSVLKVALWKIQFGTVELKFSDCAIVNEF